MTLTTLQRRSLLASRFTVTSITRFSLPRLLASSTFIFAFLNSHFYFLPRIEKTLQTSVALSPSSSLFSRLVIPFNSTLDTSTLVAFPPPVPSLTHRTMNFARVNLSPLPNTRPLTASSVSDQLFAHEQRKQGLGARLRQTVKAVGKKTEIELPTRFAEPDLSSLTPQSQVRSTLTPSLLR